MAKKHSNAFTDSDIVIREQAAPEIPAEPVTTISGYVFETKAIPNRTGKKGTLDYPISELTAGSPVSFLVPATPENFQRVTASIRTYAYRKGFTVTLRTDDGGIRVWRTESKAVTA